MKSPVNHQEVSSWIAVKLGVPQFINSVCHLLVITGHESMGLDLLYIYIYISINGVCSVPITDISGHNWNGRIKVTMKS